jgi:hypothetical protein
MVVIKRRATMARSSVMTFAMIFRAVGKGLAIGCFGMCRRLLHKMKFIVYFCAEIAQDGRWRGTQPFERAADSSMGSRLVPAFSKKADF